MKLNHRNLTLNQFLALRSFPLFRQLTEEQLSAIIGFWHLKKYSAGALVMLENYTGDEVSVFLEGRAKIYYCDNHGREMMIGYKGKGDVVGEMGFIDGGPRSAIVETITPSTLLWTNRDKFRQCCQIAPCIFNNLLEIMTSQLRTTNTRMQVLQAPDAICRVARLLVHLAQKVDSAEEIYLVPFKLSQSDIGALTGLSRASVNHVLARWKQRNYITIDTRCHITIYDFVALKQEAGVSDLQ